jgi:hypothetical protein
VQRDNAAEPGKNKRLLTPNFLYDLTDTNESKQAYACEQDPPPDEGNCVKRNHIAKDGGEAPEEYGNVQFAVGTVFGVSHL